MNVPLDNPCGCEYDDCEPCAAYWCAYNIEEEDEKDRRINWKDYV